MNYEMDDTKTSFCTKIICALTAGHSKNIESLVSIADSKIVWFGSTCPS